MGYVGQAPTAAVLTADDITDGIIANADIASDAAIALSKTALSAGTGVTLSTNTLNVDAAQTGITSAYNASLKVGRDADNLVDFATTDNKIILRVEGVNEVELVQNALSPVTSDGVALGTGSLMWSDLFLASASVINFNNGDVTITHAANTLTIAGGNLTMADDTVINLGEAGKIDFGDEEPADDAATGIVFSFIAGATLAIGDVVYMGTGGKVLKADANQVTTMPAIGICVSAGSDTNAVDVLVQGIMHDTSAFPTFSTGGADVFVSAAATGAVVATAPSGSGDTVQKIGVALHADMIYFNFNTTEVLLA